MPPMAAMIETHVAMRTDSPRKIHPKTAVINGAVAKSNSNYHGSVATFKCNNGYKLNVATTITCSAASADAAWPRRMPPPVCTGMYNCDSVARR